MVAHEANPSGNQQEDRPISQAKLMSQRRPGGGPVHRYSFGEVVDLDNPVSFCHIAGNSIPCVVARGLSCGHAPKVRGSCSRENGGRADLLGRLTARSSPTSAKASRDGRTLDWETVALK